MVLKDQINKIKDNWLLIVIFLILFFAMIFMMSGGLYSVGGVRSSSMDIAYGGQFYDGRVSSSLAPDIVDRILIKTASLTTVVNDFNDAELRLKNIIDINNGIIVNQNVNTRYSKYKNGHYTVSVPTNNYDNAVAALKTIGQVESFNERANDITGSYIRLQDLLESEKNKLRTYEQMQSQTSNIDEKLRLTDRIFDQMNKIRSLEYQIANQDDRVEYSQININLREKTPRHANVIFATFSDLWSSFKASVNALLYLIAYVLPFVIAYFIFKLLLFIYRKILR
ncbi:MAG: DUF4349 domain-containing protein [Candidatus Woesearchaeota archaeon]